VAHAVLAIKRSIPRRLTFSPQPDYSADLLPHRSWASAAPERMSRYSALILERMRQMGWQPLATHEVSSRAEQARGPMIAARSWGKRSRGTCFCFSEPAPTTKEWGAPGPSHLGTWDTTNPTPQPCIRARVESLPRAKSKGAVTAPCRRIRSAFRDLHPAQEMGCPILASLGWEITNPNRPALYQGLASAMPKVPSVEGSVAVFRALHRPR
jgi:hypothetical protein